MQRSLRKEPRWPAVSLFGLMLLTGFLFFIGPFHHVSAYNTCDRRGYCGSHWYIATVSWRDDTGWSGASAQAISDSGLRWHYASRLNVSQYQSSGPVNASVGLAAMGTLYDPGVTYTYWNASDPHEVIQANSYLNSSWTWNTSGYLNQSTAQADVRTITLHEMGHWMFLGHDSYHTEAVMWPNYVQKWYLATDDINGMWVLYP